MAFEALITGANLDTANGNIKVVRPRREIFGSLVSGASEVVLDLNGDSNAIAYLSNTSFVGTLEFTGSAETSGAAYFPIVAFSYAAPTLVGTPANSAQPLFTDAVTAGSIRVYQIPCGQLKRIRVRVSVFTSGTAVLTLGSDEADSFNTTEQVRPATLTVSTLGAVGAATTLTLPAATGFRHVIDQIRITRSATAALTAAATPIAITSSNIPGNIQWTMGQDAGGIGVDREIVQDCGPYGLATFAISSNTQVSCPAYVGVVWRINAIYRLGL